MPTTPKQLAPKLTKRLLAYSTVAAAAAACAPAAQAKIVYTPAHRYVNGDFYIDLNHDGILDFHIHSSFLSGVGQLQAFPAVATNKLAAVPGNCRVGYGAAALALGATIGPGEPFAPSATCMGEKSSSFLSNGPWVSFFRQERYLGFEFVIAGKKHYGWARMEFDGFTFDHTARVLGFAYETVANKPIRAGDEGKSPQASAPPGTLGALAQGSRSRFAAKGKE